jgi:hypothetical protein
MNLIRKNLTRGKATLLIGVFLVSLYTVAGMAITPEGTPFDAIWAAIEDLQVQIDDIQLIPGPPGSEGPEGPPGPEGPSGSTGTPVLYTTNEEWEVELSTWDPEPIFLTDLDFYSGEGTVLIMFSSIIEFPDETTTAKLYIILDGLTQVIAIEDNCGTHTISIHATAYVNSGPHSVRIDGWSWDTGTYVTIRELTVLACPP